MLEDGYQGELAAGQKEFLDIILASSQHMVDIVNMLLNLSRIEAGRISVAPVELALDSLLQQALDELQPKIAAKQQVVTQEIEEGLPLIKVDPAVIQEIFSNLLSNAVKYTPAQGTITISMTQNDKQIITRISDSGYGIPPQEQSRVFSKFYRGTNILKAETEGTGLGLYLVKTLVELVGGKISFESELGKGTTFTVTFPKKGMKTIKGDVSIE
jgi:signal transduction histidine kinase